MSINLKNLAKRFLPKQLHSFARQVGWKVNKIRVEEGSWLSTGLPLQELSPDEKKKLEKIEEISDNTDQLGLRPLWDGYIGLKNYPSDISDGSKRSSNQVRTGRQAGAFFVRLVKSRKPDTIIEFGTAFGISGMYWLLGLECNNSGHLYTFDPNEDWVAIARRNLCNISDRFTSTLGTFEDNLDVLDRSNVKIDLCFIDAIHTSDFVNAQLELVLQRSSSNSILVFDDIWFSEDMRNCWENIKKQNRFSAVLELPRVGIVEVR